MRVVITGSGRVGREVAQALSAMGDDVSLLDESEEAFELLGRTFNGTLHVGVTYDVDALRAAGIEEADVFLALTPSDNANLMAVQLAERLKQDSRTPEHMMRVVSRALETSPEIVLTRLNWKYGVPGESTNKAQHEVPPVAGSRWQEWGMLEAEVRPFHGDYRAAMASIEVSKPELLGVLPQQEYDRFSRNRDVRCPGRDDQDRPATDDLHRLGFDCQAACLCRYWSG